MLGNAEEAEDAAQEAFIRAYSNLRRYDPERRFRNWLLSIASNHCIDRLRKRRFVAVPIEEEPQGEQLASSMESPHRAAERHEAAEQVQTWLDQLTPDYRVPVVLLYWYDFSYEEIAGTLNLTVPAVKSRLHRARKQIADIILTEQQQTAAPLPYSVPLPAAVSG